jgi:ankyrin repeat protein
MRDYIIGVQVSELKTFILMLLLGHFDFVQWCLDNGVSSIADADAEGRTALIYSVKGGSVTLVDYLIQSGSSANEADNKGNTALIHAVTHKELAIAKCLIQHGATITDANVGGLTALHHAAMRDLATTQWLLIDVMANITEKDKDGMNALMHGVAEDQLETVQWMVSHGWAVVTETIADKNWNLCHIAAKYGSLRVLEWLISQGVVPAAREIHGFTPMLLAVT